MGEKTEKLLVLDVIGETGFYEIIIDKESEPLDTFYKHLHCDCFDITHRRVDGVWFDIFVDDIGLLKDSPISAVDKARQPALVGNLIFAHHDMAGNTTGLSDEDIQHIKRNRLIALKVDDNGNVTGHVDIVGNME